MTADTFVAKNWTSMIRPIALEVDSDHLRADYGKFAARPLERGYGQTLGNSLRRVLLSSLQGAGTEAERYDQRRKMERKEGYVKWKNMV